MRVQLGSLFLICVLNCAIGGNETSQNFTCDKSTQFACDDQSCIPIKEKCNGIHDCKDGSDETNCSNHCKPPFWFKCSDDQCITADLVCDGEYDCLDLSDERNCGPLANRACSPNEFGCREGLCISSLWKCNGIEECLHGEDEKSCTTMYCKDSAKCGSGECIQESWICDGVFDCRDDSDEKNCGSKTKPEFCTSDRGLVLCGDKTHCIPHEEVCDGVVNCEDKSDELFCASQHCAKIESDKRNGTLCICPPGYHLNGVECKDIDECLQYGLCDQKCSNVKGGHNCSCVEGYHLQKDGKTCEVSEGDAVLYYTDKVSIKKLLIKSKTTFSMVKDLSKVMALAFYDNHIYYTEEVEDNYKISSADGSGNKKQSLVTIGLGEPKIIAIDFITTNLYFTDVKLQHIAVCTINGAYCTILPVSVQDKPHGLALHPVRGEMFWSEWGTTPRIARASMDGKNEENFITDNLGSPMGIAIDVYTSRLFWTDSQKKLIESIKLDGTDRRIIFKANLIHPFSLAVFENRVYWSDLTTRTIESCEKFNGRNHKILVKYAQESISNIEVHHPILHENHTNVCKNASCSELCLLTYRGGYTCQCSEGKRLNYTTMECIDVISPQRILVGTVNSLWTMEYKPLGKVNVTKLPIVVQNITAVAYDTSNNTLFIADGNTKTIIKVNLHDYKADIIITNIDGITALDFDYLGNNMYWCDSKRGNVEVFNLKTKLRRIIAVLPPGAKPISIALVPEFGYIFLSVQTFKGISVVDFLYMDGSKPIKIIRDSLVGPVYVTYDPLSKNVFWTDSSTGNIESFHIVDKLKKVFRSSQASVAGILASQNDVFWIKQKSNKLFWGDRSDLDHRNNHYKIDEINNNEDIIHFISISPRSSSIHPCENHNGNCSHICIPGENMSARCTCPPGMNLTSDGKTCLEVLNCPENEFLCNKSEICIPISSKCNHHKDCIYGEDENDCPKVDNCPNEYFQCHNGDCINKSLVCDLNFDCRDESDELNCDVIVIHAKCNHNEFTCSDRKCIPQTSVCNNKEDCVNGEDEANCHNPKCRKGYYRCPIGGCIPESWVCDGEEDCLDGSDESDDCDYKKCPDPNFTCDTGLCITSDLVCNNINDCGDNSDELECKKNYTNNCKSNEFSCYKSKSMCLPLAVRCNETSECPNYEDEEGCPRCPLGEFMCSDGKCIPSMYVCDGYEDCDDRSDESYSFCSHLIPTEEPYNKTISCGNKFTCNDGQCIDNHLVCNGGYNCHDQSDEGELCSTPCNKSCTSCKKTPQGPKCLCEEGFKLASDHFTCIDIQECKLEPPVCSQICEELKGSFNCKCYENFYLRPDRVSCKSVEENLAYTFMSNNTIFSITPHRQKLEEVFVAHSVLNITDFDIVISKNLIYFIAENEGQLHRINLKTKRHFYMVGLGRPQLLSVDWISENVYYVNENVTNRLIHVCNFETHYCSAIHSIKGNKTQITALKVDAVNKLVFYAVLEIGSSPKSKIYKCNLDGSYVEEIHVSNDDYVTGMTFDFHKKILYFTDRNDGLLFKITYRGTDQMTILQNFPNSSGLNTYENHLYFFNSKRELQICPLFGNYHACTHNILHDIEIEKFVMNHSSLQPPSNRSECKVIKCYNKLCVPTGDTVKCLCESTKLGGGHSENCIKYRWAKYSRKKKGKDSNNKVAIWIWILLCITVAVAVIFGVYVYHPETTRTMIHQSVRYVARRGDKDAELLIGD